MESREMSGMVSRQFHLIEIQLECFRIVKNILFYSVFGRNRPIKTMERSIVDRLN